MPVITISIPKSLLEGLKIVEDDYPSRSEAIRTAIRQFLLTEARLMAEIKAGFPSRVPKVENPPERAPDLRKPGDYNAMIAAFNEIKDKIKPEGGLLR